MLDLDAVLPVSDNVESYENRCHEMVSLLATHSGKSPQFEIETFSKVMGQLRHEYQSSPPPADGLAQLQQQIIKTIPNVVEFVLSYSQEDFQGFGYLTQGPPGNTLSESLSNLLANTFHVYLDNGGSRGNAELLADLFALAFPNLSARK